MQKNKRLSPGKITVIVIASILVALAVGLLIFNAFIPLRYASAYLQKEEPRDYDFRVTYLDAGYGDSALVDLPDGKTLLIDGGEYAYTRSLDLLKRLNARGVEEIDYLICTSVKKEHCGGLTELLRHKGVKTAFIPYCKIDRINDSYYGFITLLKESGAQCEYACAGTGIASEDGRYMFTFLSPAHYLSPGSLYGVMNSEPTEMNIDNASAVVYLECDGLKFIFTSDVRKDVLDGIVEEYKLCKLTGTPFRKLGEKCAELESCNFVTIPAHGNERGVSASWYELISADNAVVSVGKNYAGCPSPIAVAPVNYKTTYYTMYSGTITVTVNGGVYTVSKEKK